MARKAAGPLTAKARAYADGWAGPGTGVGAARAAGYGGSDRSLTVTSSQLLADPRVRARIVKRVGAEQFAKWMAVPEAPLPPAIPPPARPLVKGKGRGTATERIELSMSIGRDKRLEAKERLAGIRLAAELEGELRSGGAGRRVVIGPTSAPIGATSTGAPSKGDPAKAPGGAPAGLRLITNRKDAELGT